MISLCIITTTRADYGLLYPLIKKIYKDKFFDLKVVVTGTHLSKFYGNTIRYIKDDKIPIFEKIDIINNIKINTTENICNTISIGIKKFSEFFNKNLFDAIIVLGDRYELWSICIPAYLNNIKIVHINGGDTTLGSLDESTRNCITSIAKIHFPTIEKHKQKIINILNKDEYVYTVGSLSIDNIFLNKILSIDDLVQNINVSNYTFSINTYHPSNLSKNCVDEIIILLESLKEFDNILHIFTYPNADFGNNCVVQKIKLYEKKYKNKFKVFDSIGQQNYFSILKHAKFMTGNSSSGILEASSFALPVINIGDRQKGRYFTKNVLNCNFEKNEILKNIKICLSNEFKESIRFIKNPYGDGRTSEKIIKHLKSFFVENNRK